MANGSCATHGAQDEIYFEAVRERQKLKEELRDRELTSERASRALTVANAELDRMREAMRQVSAQQRQQQQEEEERQRLRQRPPPMDVSASSMGGVRGGMDFPRVSTTAAEPPSERSLAGSEERKREASVLELEAAQRELEERRRVWRQSHLARQRADAAAVETNLQLVDERRLGELPRAAVETPASAMCARPTASGGAGAIVRVGGTHVDAGGSGMAGRSDVDVLAVLREAASASEAARVANERAISAEREAAALRAELASRRAECEAVASTLGVSLHAAEGVTTSLAAEVAAVRARGHAKALSGLAARTRAERERRASEAATATMHGCVATAQRTATQADFGVRCLALELRTAEAISDGERTARQAAEAMADEARARIGALEAQIASRDAEIASRDAEIAFRDAEIASRDAEVRASEDVRASLTVEMEARAADATDAARRASEARALEEEVRRAAQAERTAVAQTVQALQAESAGLRAEHGAFRTDARRRERPR